VNVKDEPLPLVEPPPERVVELPFPLGLPKTLFGD
jgi:hypothetical protein